LKGKGGEGTARSPKPDKSKKTTGRLDVTEKLREGGDG